MTFIRRTSLGVLVVTIGLSCASTLTLPVFAEGVAAKEASQTTLVRSEIATTLAAAQKLFDSKEVKEALNKLAETDVISDKTANEIFAVERLRGHYFMAAGDKAKAVKAFELVVNTHYLTGVDQLSMTEAIAFLYFQLEDYPSTMSWITRYISEGGTDAKAKPLLHQAQYLNKDYANAVKGISEDIQEEKAANKIPSEQNLKLLVSCKTLMNDREGLQKAVEELNSYYPTEKNWLYLLSLIPHRSGFAERMYLDIYRLKQELNLMADASEYIDMSDLAMRLGLPSEAKNVLEKAVAAGVKKGAEAKKIEGLQNRANKQALDDLKTMQQGEASALNSRDGNGLVNLGLAYATAGQLDKGVRFIEQGISKGGLTRPEEAKLHLGIVYYWVGKKEEAIKVFGTIHSHDGIEDLARYWVMQINHPLAKSSLTN